MEYFALTGPASTGKTTIFNDVRMPLVEFAETKGLNVVFHEERIRTIFEQEFAGKYASFEELLDDDPLYFQLRASEAFMEDALSVRDRDTIIFADRMGLDVLVYTQVNIARGFRNFQYETKICDNLKRAMLRISKAFMTRPLTFVEKDGFRPDCYTGGMRVLEENLFNVLGGTHPSTVWLPSGREERVNLIMSTIRGVYE